MATNDLKTIQFDQHMVKDLEKSSSNSRILMDPGSNILNFTMACMEWIIDLLSSDKSIRLK